MLSSGCDFFFKACVYMRASFSPTDWKCVWVRVMRVNARECVCVCVCKREYKRGSRDKKWCSSFSCLSPRGAKEELSFRAWNCVKRSCGKIARGENVRSMCLSWAMKKGECLFLLGTCFMEKLELVKAFQRLSEGREMQLYCELWYPILELVWFYS